MPKKESLPVGVGRVPAWWMELTPHYTLDLEEDETRRQQEEQEALYYAQMAAADDARTSGEWKSHWGGRSANGGGGNGGEDGEPLFGGRNFQPGSDGWDPKEWGIETSDPDYKSYLQGAKLPQSYIDAMKAFGGQHGIKYDASSLKNTTSVYGSAGGKPNFTPAWAKKKLRSTGQGAAIRHGIYHDSPNKHLKKKGVNQMAEEHEGSPPSSPQLADPPTPTQNPEPATPAAPAPAPVPAPDPAPMAPPSPVSTPMVSPAPKPVASPPAPKWKTSTPAPKPVVYQLPTPRSNTPAPAPVVDQTQEERDLPKYSFKYVVVTAPCVFFFFFSNL